ncbi:hypothetical protein chiPu_0006404 [Chiloscyllium punctatum]|uniref:Uncharacterized protein n=1 Tax=Chiloscyllium punctatum TaxID=137246 RepID=A0A401SC52_CHIPU|nr:hypothetical protein [Chiloscyllium punctatum]
MQCTKVSHTRTYKKNLQHSRDQWHSVDKTKWLLASSRCRKSKDQATLQKVKQHLDSQYHCVTHRSSQVFGTSKTTLEINPLKPAPGNPQLGLC